MLSSYVMGCLTVVIMMFVIWLIHLGLRNATIVDMGWGLGFILMTAIFVHQGAGWTPRNKIFFTLIVLWGVRIIYFIFKRIIQEKEEDRRYNDLRLKWKDHAPLKFLRIFELQAVLQMGIVLPILCITNNTVNEIYLVDVLGIFICAVSIIAEAIADEQLRNFKINPANKGKTCQVGLWNYSRHPNYFFEILFWIGVYVCALSSPWGWLTVISPILVIHIIWNITGIPLAEQQSLRSRGDEYRKYQETTSVLIPLPKKRILL